MACDVSPVAMFLVAVEPPASSSAQFEQSQFEKSSQQTQLENSSQQTQPEMQIGPQGVIIGVCKGAPLIS